MKINKALVSLLGLVCLLTFFVPARAQEGASDLDKECADFCSQNAYEDGHYLAPEPDASCRDGYTKNLDNEICCCKNKE